jgi:hypothetical protein
MTRNDLKALAAKAEAGEATINDLVKIAAASFESQTRHFQEIKAMLETMSGRMEMVQRQTFTPLYVNIIEDEQEAEAETVEP